MVYLQRTVQEDGEVPANATCVNQLTGAAGTSAQAKHRAHTPVQHPAPPLAPVCIRHSWLTLSWAAQMCLQGVLLSWGHLWKGKLKSRMFTERKHWEGAQATDIKLLEGVQRRPRGWCRVCRRSCVRSS